MFFQIDELLIDILKPPFIRIAENAAAIGRKTGAVDHGQIHILGPIADAFFNHQGCFINAEGEQRICNFIFGHLFGRDPVVLKIFLDDLYDFWIGYRLVSTVIKITGAGFTAKAAGLVNEFG